MSCSIQTWQEAAFMASVDVSGLLLLSLRAMQTGKCVLFAVHESCSHSKQSPDIVKETKEALLRGQNNEKKTHTKRGKNNKNFRPKQKHKKRIVKTTFNNGVWLDACAKRFNKYCQMGTHMSFLAENHSHDLLTQLGWTIEGAGG
jgi:hypothetical protein